jgi:sortase A
MAWLRVVGKLLISLGIGVLLFVAWILWGTGIYTSQQQDKLRDELESLPPLTAQASEGNNAGDSPYGSPGDGFTPAAGEPVFAIDIPDIDRGDVVVQGVGVEELKSGPGHYPDCREGFAKPLCTDEEEVWPGERGRVVLSGHRTTWGQPFRHLDDLEPDDKIITRTRWGTFTYRVTRTEIILPQGPEADQVVQPDPPGNKAELVLTTCNPPLSAAERLIVYAELETSS